MSFYRQKINNFSFIALFSLDGLNTAKSFDIF